MSDDVRIDPFSGAELVSVLPSADLDRAELWYGRVGFQIVASYPDYRIVQAGDVHLHLRLQADADPTTSESGVFLYLADPEALRQVHDAWVAAGARIIAPPTEQPYGLVEFATEDPDGNLWRVGAPVEPPAGADAVDRGEAVEEFGVAPTPEATGEIDVEVAGDLPADGTPAPVAGDDDASHDKGDPTSYPGSPRTGSEGETDWFAVVVSGHCRWCGHDPAGGAPSAIGARIRDEAHRWTTVLRPADDELVRRRPSPDVWSALEYAVHVRDVLAVFTERVLRMLAETEPELGWWDHEAAIEDGFANESDRSAVADDLLANADRLAEVLRLVSGDQWERGGLRREDERFTIELLARFALHELAHHRIDAEGSLES